jgi:Zn-dependent peptidase ImmA (M78 family)/transcriptional regulator with XRE-family HTH domain
MASRSLDAKVEPRVLAWARESAGYGRADVARRLRVEPARIAQWEAGDSTPTVSRLRKLANIYKRPLAAFFLPEPPSEPPHPSDFRSQDPVFDIEYPPALILAIRKARRATEVVSELTATLRDSLPEGEIPAIQSTTPAEDAAHELRSDLGITMKSQVAWKSSRQAYDEWSRALEHRRVLVLQMRDVEMEVARAFSIGGSPFSAIVVNSKDSWNGKIFSIFHEYAHLALKEAGVCDFRERLGRGSAGKPVEVFCNHVAAAFLLPEKELLATDEIRRSLAQGKWNDEDVTSLARDFHVSYEAVLRRMTTLQLVSLSVYRAIHNRLKDQQRKGKKQAKKFGPPPPVKAVLDNGLYFTSLVLEGISKEQVPMSAVRDYLGAYPKHLDEIERLMRTKVG